MPASATIPNRPETMIDRLTLAKSEQLLKVLREIKNQIIGNKTKKVLYLKLGAVPKIVAVLAAAAAAEDAAIVVQAAAAIGSFACGVEDGVRAVVEAGAVEELTRVLSFDDEKVAGAGARALRMIFQSKLAPKYDILQEKNMKFLLSLLNSENENVSELAASVISHSCKKAAEQKALSDVGVLERLSVLLKGSLNQRDSCLESVAVMVKNNSEVASKFACINNGTALSTLSELIHDRSPRTRLLASVCLISLGSASPCYVQELQARNKLILTLVELLEEPGRVGDDAPFALSDLLEGKEELHKEAVSISVIEKLCDFLSKGTVQARRLEGILLALAQLCSKLEICRQKLISLQVLDIIADALKHDSTGVRIAACMCIKSVSRSVKGLSAGTFSSETLLVPLIQLLNDSTYSVQVAALDAICNVAIDFSPQKSVFIQLGGVNQLVQLSKSMDSTIRLKSVCALRNLMFLGDQINRHRILSEITVSTLHSLITDPELIIQEQALALISNFVNGCFGSIEYLMTESNIIAAIVRQLHSVTSPEVCIQGLLVLSNIAAGDESHKDAVMSYLIPLQADGCGTLFIIKFMQSQHSLLRTAAVWCIVNLTHPKSIGSSTRIARLQHAGIVSQVKLMVNDPFLDCKFRARMALGQCGQCSSFESKST